MVLGGREQSAEAARDLEAKCFLLRRGRRCHWDQMAKHHAGNAAGRMDVSIGCGRGLAEGVEMTKGNVAVTVYTVHRHAKLDVVGKLFSPGSLRLLGGTYRRGAGWRRRKGTRRQYRGNQKRFREYTSFYISSHNSSAPQWQRNPRDIIKGPLTVVSR